MAVAAAVVARLTLCSRRLDVESKWFVFVSSRPSTTTEPPSSSLSIFHIIQLRRCNSAEHSGRHATRHWESLRGASSCLMSPFNLDDNGGETPLIRLLQPSVQIWQLKYSREIKWSCVLSPENFGDQLTLVTGERSKRQRIADEAGQGRRQV